MYEEIEKTNLEAHVAICALRYANLDKRLSKLDELIVKLDTRIQHIESGMGEIKQMMSEMSQQRHQQLISWGVAIIGTLTAALSFLAYQLFSKDPM